MAETAPFLLHLPLKRRSQKRTRDYEVRKAAKRALRGLRRLGVRPEAPAKVLKVKPRAVIEEVSCDCGGLSGVRVS